MDFHLDSAKDAEFQALAKIDRLARRLKRENPRLSIHIARAMATQKLPKTALRYMRAREVLQRFGSRPISFDEI